MSPLCSILLCPAGSDLIRAIRRPHGLIGALNSLSQLALKAMLPGVPDFYQGTEFWDFSWSIPTTVVRSISPRALEALAMGDIDWPDLAAHWQDGRIKLALTRRLLKLRHHHPDLFSRGTYEQWR